MKIKKRTNNVRAKRENRHARLRKKISGSAARPRLSLFKGGRSLFAQVIDDEGGKTILG
ncbi:MAG TPA: 50S ribosomal protein L18, partial [bacterium]|nr:50S ribosomal protein L18 [bacterium]